jgi:hypothetical protein
MSAIIWSAEEGWHDGPAARVELDGGRLRITPVTACVGFADCPCKKCRATRLAANQAHPHHEHGQAAYCEPCNRARRAL